MAGLLSSARQCCLHKPRPRKTRVGTLCSGQGQVGAGVNSSFRSAVKNGGSDDLITIINHPLRVQSSSRSSLDHEHKHISGKGVGCISSESRHRAAPSFDHSSTDASLDSLL